MTSHGSTEEDDSRQVPARVSDYLVPGKLDAGE